MVVEVLRARDERLAVRRREEEAAAFLVGEEVDGEHREPVRLEEPPRLAGRHVQLVEPVRDVGVVLEVAGSLRAAGAVGSEEAPVVAGERTEQELGGIDRGRDEVAALEPSPRLGQRRDGHAVPGRDRLVVAERLRPLLSELEEPGARLLVELAAQDEAPVLERLEELLRRPLGRRPRERQPLDAFRVRVLRRGQLPLRQPQLAQHVLERLLGDAAVALLAGDHPGVEVDGREERVVVEHLLEVRDEPPPVDGVAVEAAADEVVHASRGHAVEGLPHRVELVPAQEELERRCGRELRRAAEAAPLRVELPA